MTNDPMTWVVAVLEVIAAGIIAAFWIWWLGSDHDEPWLPAGYVDHEAPFVFTDSILALLLAVGAVLQVLEEPAGDSVGLIAGGMLVFLGVLDAAYFVRTGLFHKERDGVMHGSIVFAVLTLAVILIVRFF